MAAEWDRLRTFDGSVANAFEEVCAQVARIASEAEEYRFVRNGKPDGGLECYAVRSDGGLIGWQAKWFRTAPATSQWRQITESFQRALTTYPALRRFIVCLPQDRGTSGGARQCPMERWNSHVEAWNTDAAKLGRTIEFEYWGTSDIIARLSARGQLGRTKYWLEREFLTSEWFRRRFEEARENNRRRYRPELNVDLPHVSSWLGPLLQTHAYVDEIRDQLAAVWDALHAFAAQNAGANASEGVSESNATAESVERLLELLPTAAEGSLPIAQLQEMIGTADATLLEQSAQTPPESSGGQSREWDRAFYGLHEGLRELGEYTVGAFTPINESKSVLVRGEAGKGKTHLLLRIADELSQLELPVVIGFGINFTTGDPWDQLVRSLGLRCDRDEFLGALNAAGEANQTRALIIVDALNESDDPTIWRRSLGGMLSAIREYPFVAMALSVRSEFAQEVLLDGLTDEELPQIEHPGFQGEEARATTEIFRHFGLSAPQIPLLVPEFSNPLFVVTLAESLQEEGFTAIPAGARGIRWVFDLWLNAVNRRLAAPENLDYDVSVCRVHEAASALAHAMADGGTKLLPEGNARRLVEEVHPSIQWSNSLYRALLDEDVIQRVRHCGLTDDRTVTRVRFTFDRFADHLIVRSVLKEINDAEDLRVALAPNGRLRHFLIRERGESAWVDPGLLLALAIELPEDCRFRCELATVLPEERLTGAAHQAMLDSVSWRSPETIGDQVMTLFRSEIRRVRRASMEEQHKLVERLLPLAIRPGCPLNARFLDSELRSEPMPQRDYWWSRPLTQLSRPHSVVMRFVDWMCSPAARDSDNETARLSAIAATWLFTTSNRFIRDRATKALVSMLMNRPSIAAELVDGFLGVDDLYVVERVLAVGYGVALRTGDVEGLGLLGNLVYSRCFQGGELPEHLLARDYARGIVETAIRCGAPLDADPESIQPPYRSSWPTQISCYEAWETRMRRFRREERGLHDVWRSISNEGDFGHYVIGGIFGLHGWMRYRHSDTLPNTLISNESDDFASRSTEPDADVPREDAQQDRADAKPKPVVFAVPERPPPSRQTPSGRPLTRTELKWSAWFPPVQVQCMVADDVIALGYTSRLDEDVKSHDPSGEYAGRSARKSERIGKKYQWIALQRTQARIADRFRFGGDWEIRADTRFDGPWELLRGRDIDPSCLLRRTVGRHHSSSEPCWWAPFANTKFDRVCSDVDWIRDASTVPSRDDLCEVVEPTTGRAWIVGSRWVTIVARKPTGLTSELWHRRSIWYRTAGVFVSANDSAMLIDWLNEKRRELGQNGANLLPQDPYLHPCFLREFPNAPAWEYENRPYFARDPWCVGDGERAPPVAVSLLSDRYFDSGELNCGRDEPLEFHLPSAELAVGLGLRHAEQDGHFENASGRLIAWDPSVTLSGPMAMLLDRDAVVQYAAERDLHIVLFVYGEQRASADVSDHEAYLGQLLFSGAFLHDGAAWSGSIDSRFEPPPNERPSLQGIAMNP